MRSRIDFHDELVYLLGSKNVYFQPTVNVKMNYPAIVYSINGFPARHANNDVYIQATSYKVTLIDKNPDNELKYKLSMFPRSRLVTTFTSENLNHYVFNIDF